MRVLQIITSLATGGAEKLILDSVPLYEKKNIKVDVLVLKNDKTVFWSKLRENFSGELRGLSSGSPYNPFLIFKIIPYLKDYSIIHAHLFPTLYWIVLAKMFSFSRVKIIYTEHSTENRRRNFFWFKILDRFIYKRLDRIICIGESAKRNLVMHLKFTQNIEVINNGIVVENFIKGEVHRYNFFNEKDFMLIQVSSFREQKDQKTLIESLPYLPSKIKLLLVGDGRLINQHKLLVKTLNLEDRVMFLGLRDDIPLLLQYSDIVVLSSHYEGFGLAIVEGMASSKPVIASEVSGLREIVNGYGLVFEKGNSQKLAEKINQLFTDKSFYREVADKCFLRAQEFHINKMIDKYIELYRTVIREKN